MFYDYKYFYLFVPFCFRWSSSFTICFFFFAFLCIDGNVSYICLIPGSSFSFN